MEVPAQTSLIADALAVLHAECDSAAVRRLFVNAMRAVRSAPELDGVCSISLASESEHLLWHDCCTGSLTPGRSYSATV